MTIEKKEKGLSLSREYFNATIEQLLLAVPEAEGRIAAGLVGEGSQCFGFDDKISQDHDFGPGFCIWLTDEDFNQFGQALQQAYYRLPNEFHGFSRQNLQVMDRLGVMKISEFYHRFTGAVSGVPESNSDWLFTPENQLAAAVNGEVFRDDVGLFSEIRQELKKFYPEDVRLKKIAARAAVMSQAGQYNLLRVIQRGDSVAAILALSRFTEAAISMTYLLDKKYMPFYKWSFHGLETEISSELALTLKPLLKTLIEIPTALTKPDTSGAFNLAFQLTEEICTAVVRELNRQEISHMASPFLQDHLEEIMSNIADPQLQRLPPMFDCE